MSPEAWRDELLAVTGGEWDVGYPLWSSDHWLRLMRGDRCVTVYIRGCLVIVYIHRDQAGVWAEPHMRGSIHSTLPDPRALGAAILACLDSGDTMPLRVLTERPAEVTP